ncbi:hypothetical protein I302_102873 [Kwoniella bestiolae CBS 10118]|uniref:Uncharacterized protein n=1 Tax=Kwoniella bestiolae CBS 10118 TaxID=1296100 RepID=A0A1B9GG59_9TREE|nr:hypothetical protein I302_01568 [Kwoniella bestiolae CBS 10118]OCF30050.1 hypothetical protein I302_01568 [Kwoniella bestiolae CBS 10118]
MIPESTRRPYSMNTQETAVPMGYLSSGEPTLDLQYRHVQPSRYPLENTASSNTNPFRSHHAEPLTSHRPGLNATAYASPSNGSGDIDGLNSYHRYSPIPVDPQGGVAGVRNGSRNPYHAKLRKPSRYSALFDAQYGSRGEGPSRIDIPYCEEELNNGYDAGESSDESFKTNLFDSTKDAIRTYNDTPFIDLETQEQDPPKDTSYLLSDSDEAKSDTSRESYPPLAAMLSADHSQILHMSQVRQGSVQAQPFPSPLMDSLSCELENTKHKLEDSLRAQQEMAGKVESLERQLEFSQAAVHNLESQNAWLRDAKYDLQAECWAKEERINRLKDYHGYDARLLEMATLADKSRVAL